MPTSGSTAVAHIVLSASSLWALCQHPEISFASLGFGLYFLTGILGILSYGVGSASRQLYSLYNEVMYISLSLALPSFISQLYLKSCHTLAIAHFILPLAYLISRVYIKRNSFPVLESMQIIYLAFLAYMSLMRGCYYGLSTTASFIIAFYAIGTSGTVKNAPSRDLFCYSLSFSIYFLNRTLLGY